MKLTDRTDTVLVLTDTQMDKAIALYGISLILVAFAANMAWQGDWGLVWPPLVIAAAALAYLRLTRIAVTIRFDKTEDRIDLDIHRVRGGTEHWDWTLSDLDTAALSTRQRDGIKRPVLIFKDGTHVPMRPYHSAGTQSWHAVAAVRLFLGQSIKEDAPVGWIPPEEFDRFFADEMKRLYKP